jgi:thiamine transporter ThiT
MSISCPDEKGAAANYLDISHAVIGYVDSPIGPVARIATALSVKDILHDWKARWSVRRSHFRIPTGIYAVGNPGESSPVLVTANYKLTFDKLRIELGLMDLWILVIDTKGVNVWCSAGKGTFSAPEIISKIRQTGLAKIVSHRQLILPQLAAPGVSAQAVSKAAGFKVVYGPIKAKDIPAFIANGCNATPAMRRVTFDLSERIVLTPVELLMTSKYIPIAVLMFFLINLINNGGLSLNQVLKVAGFNSLPYLIAIVIGCFIVPVMLPVLPFRSFAAKGTVAGIIWSLIVMRLGDVFMFSSSLSIILANSLLLTAIVAFLALNFTGSTPFTSFSGTQKETLRAVPIIMIASVIGLVLLVIGRFA